jgi:sterol desaturase/sphingolipid hydroxylase (fatty acid hydroxylase superfamily)
MSSTPFRSRTMKTPAQTSPGRPLRLQRLILWPLYVVAILASLFWADANDLRGPVRGALAIGSIVLIAIFERIGPLDRLQRLVAERATLHDLGHLAANAATGVLSGFLGIGSGWIVVQHIAPSLGAVSIWPANAPWLAQCALAVFAADFLGYWVHRAEHGLPSFWAYHVIHHDIERLHILRGTREHFVTNLIRGFLIAGPLVALGAPIEALFAYQTLNVTTGSIAHANLTVRIPDAVNRWIVTPPVHRIHHARARALSDSNFSTITPVWDRLFGTWTDPATQPPPQIGVDGDSAPDTFLGQLALPFRRWFGL